MSETPETDKEHWRILGDNEILATQEIDHMTDFARTLETQRDEARAIIADAIDLLDGNIHHSDVNQNDELLRKMVMHLEAMFDEVKLRRERDEAMAEVERLRKRGQKIHRRTQKAESRVCHISRLYDKWKGNAEFWHRNFLEHHGIELKPVPPAQPEIFEAHGREWYRHAPGDKMPCEPGARVKIFLSMIEDNSKNAALPGYEWEWNEYGSIIGWRPADAPEKLPRK